VPASLTTNSWMLGAALGTLGLFGFLIFGGGNDLYCVICFKFGILEL
jgi:hypothetical protein